MVDFKIKNNIPAPSKIIGSPQCAIMASIIPTLQIGQHFDTPVAMRKHLSWYSWNYRNKNPLIQFVTRTTKNELGEKIVRCWRIEDLETPLKFDDLDFTDKVKSDLISLPLSTEYFIPCDRADEIKAWLDKNAPRNWKAARQRRQIRRKQVSGILVYHLPPDADSKVVTP